MRSTGMPVRVCRELPAPHDDHPPSRSELDNLPTGHPRKADLERQIAEAEARIALRKSTT